MKKANNEGSVYKRTSDGRWVAAITLGYMDAKRRYRTAVTATQREAKQKLRELQLSVEQGLSLDADRARVADVLKAWLEATQPSVRPRTFASYQMIVNQHLIPGLGRVPLKRLAPAAIEHYLRQKLESGLSNRTAQYHHAVLRAALGKAEKWKLVSHNAAKLADVPTVKRRNAPPLTPGQARLFLSSVQADRLHALYVVSLSLGLRQGETLGLRWADVDLDTRTLSVRSTLQRYGGAFHLDEPKTERSRRNIGIPEQVAEALRRHKAEQQMERYRAGDLWAGDKWNLVFANEIGEPLSGPFITRRFQAQLAALGLPEQRFHDLRHATATFLIAQGVSLRAVMEVLGHSTIVLTANTYGHVSTELTRDATERGAELLFATS